MSAPPKYSIGIDLGTTNCALSYVDLAAVDAKSQVLAIPQRDEWHTMVTETTLPSFLYRPTAADILKNQDADDARAGNWVVGRLARKLTLVTPGRVVHSAKSWLAHHAVDPNSLVLPWKSTELTTGEKSSPLAAAAELLACLRRCWDNHFAGEGDASRFDQQCVVITVPASFDAASQRATLAAARQAGYPASARLLEEPQAAFYRWLETDPASGPDAALQPGQRILVVDIGGGTSDFSLFAVSGATSDHERPEIERVAVSDHILLGGDNIDLALAHALETELTGPGDELNLDQWGHLVARARAVKERCLGGEVTSAESVNVALPSQGSGLLAGARSTQVSVTDVREMLLEGFFPFCPRSARPDRPQGALQEWGLPYAPDCAVTRYLAEFLADQPTVDAVLFNGGTLAAPLIQTRLLEQVSRWQEGRTPSCLANPETDLAVARGAAAYGARVARREQRIEAGAARALYLEAVGGNETADSTAGRLIAILPRGASVNQVYRTRVAGLRLAVNQVARFQVLQGAHACDDRCGEVREHVPHLFSRLPALEAKIDYPADATVNSAPVSLECQVNELGLLEVICVEEHEGFSGRWALEFNLRHEAVPDNIAASSAKASLAPQRRERAVKALEQGLKQRPAKASRILKAVEKAAGQPKADWDLVLSRELADATLRFSAGTGVSEEQAESWYQLAGYLLRPGFGDAADEARLRRILELKPACETATLPRRLEVAALILWRRVAAGLNAEEQIRFFDREFLGLSQPGRAVPERIRFLGALERIDVGRKEQCANLFTEAAVSARASGGYAAPYYSALGQLLSRTPFRGGPDTVLSPDVVADAFARLGKLDWRAAENAELPPLFIKAARLVEDRALDLPVRLRKKIVNKLESAGIASARCRPLLDYIPLTQADQMGFYGEALPVGLVLAGP